MARIDPRLVLPADANWQPDNTLLAAWKTSTPTGVWRADANNPWMDVEKRAVAALPPNFVTWQWTANGWVEGQNTCVSPCTPRQPAPSTEPMPIGTQISIPCR